MGEKTYFIFPHHIKHPASIIVAGVSMSGKTVFCSNLINSLNKVFFPVPTRIIISYSEDQPSYHKIKRDDTTFVKGLDFDYENIKNEPTLLIIDDQMRDGSKSNLIQDLFTKGVHHHNFSLIYITQNIFNQGKYARDMRLNSHYFVIFKSPTFVSQVQTLGRQIFPSKPHFLPDAYKKATEKPYSYLFLNLHPNCDDDLRVLTGILPNEEETYFLPT